MLVPFFKCHLSICKSDNSISLFSPSINLLGIFFFKIVLENPILIIISLLFRLKLWILKWDLFFILNYRITQLDYFLGGSLDKDRHHFLPLRVLNSCSLELVFWLEWNCASNARILPIYKRVDWKMVIHEIQKPHISRVTFGLVVKIAHLEDCAGIINNAFLQELASCRRYLLVLQNIFTWVFHGFTVNEEFSHIHLRSSDGASLTTEDLICRSNLFRSI